MEIFLKLFKPAPRDDALLNMLGEDAVHLPIDNQADQIFQTTYAGGAMRPRALAASKQHVGFTNDLAGFVETIHVMTRPLWWDHEPEAKAQRRETLEAQGFTCLSVTQMPGATGMRYRADKAGPEWLDLMNPQAVNHAVFIKNDDSVHSPMNKHYFCHRQKGKRQTELFSGFFAELCIPRSNKGAQDKGMRTIIDPAMCFDLNFQPSSFERVFWNNSAKTVITEPGQVAHVIASHQKFDVAHNGLGLAL